MTNLIGIIGQNGVGKSLTARIIQYLLSKSTHTFEIYCKANIDVFSNWKVKKFATGVNECYKIITGIDFHNLSREDKDKERPKFIEFAESCKKIFGKDVWVKKEFTDYNSESNTIFDDVRHDVEIEELDKKEGLLIEIIKGKITDKYLPYYRIVNNGTINDLIEKVKNILIEEKLL